MALPMTVEHDVQDLRERVKYLEGWKNGESERYGRLERDVVGIKIEIGQLRETMDRRFDAIKARFVQMEQRFMQVEDNWQKRFLHLDTRIDRLMWFMVATLGGVLAQIVATIATH